MACDIRVNVSVESRERVKKGLEALAESLKKGSAEIVIDRKTGALAFRGFRSADLGMSDACVFRRLSTSPEHGAEARRALASAERAAGRKMDPRAAVHSHDGGHTWGSH